LILNCDKFHQFFVFQDLRSPVDVAVLVDQRVGCHGIDQLDAVVQLLYARHTVLCAHFFAPHHGLCPEIGWNPRLHRIAS